MPDELRNEVHDIVQETGIKNISMEKKCKKAKWLSEEALKIAAKREAKSKREKERYKPLNVEFQRLARRDKKAFLSNQCKEIEENNRMGKTAAAKSLQSCPTLCDPIDGSPAGSHSWDSPGKNMEWVAISFSSA